MQFWFGPGKKRHFLFRTSPPLILKSALLLSVVFAALLSTAANQKPDVILITVDTTRADYMGFLGSTRGVTSNLDALARQSLIFTRAYSQAPLTTPSHATILTGTY